MGSPSTHSKAKGLLTPDSTCPAKTTAKKDTLPHAPFPTYPKRLKLSDLSELEELSRLSKLSKAKSSAVRLSGSGTIATPFEIRESDFESPELRSPLLKPIFEGAGGGGGGGFGREAEMFRATMEQFRKGYGGEVNGEKEEKEEEEEEKEEETMASLHEPPSSPTLPHIEDLRELPKSSQTSAPPHSILEPPITTTKKLIQGKGVLLKSNTKDSYVYHHELSAIISKNPVSKDDGDEQEEIILLAEMKEGLVAKSNTANTIVVCKSRIDANRLGRSLVKDKWIELHHTKVGKVWLFRIPHVRFLIGGRRPVDKCGICEEVIPQGKVAHGCVYTRDTFGDDCGDGENVPSSVNKKVRFALE